MMPIKAVIFDLDGTLAVFNLEYKIVRSLVKAHLMKKGVPEQLLSLDESVFEMLRKTELWARDAGKPWEFVDELRCEALNTTEAYELKAASQTNLFPDVVDTLKELRTMGLRIGLCTINSAKSVAQILERFSILNLFDVTISRNQVQHVKPHPEHLHAVLRILDTAPAETLVVGDSQVDMKSAKAVNAVAVGVPTGVSSIKQLITGGADFVVTAITDVPLLVKNLCSMHDSK